MDGGAGLGPPSDGKVFKRTFMRAAPVYIGVYGMSAEQFWYGDPWLAKYYREAYVERRKEENVRDWLQGAYIYQAVSTALANGFRKRGGKRMNYVEEPFPIFPLTAEEKAKKQEAENRKIQAVLQNMQRQQRAKKAAKDRQNAKT